MSNNTTIQFHQALNDQPKLQESIKKVISDLDEDDTVSREEKEHRDAEEEQLWLPLPFLLLSIILAPFLLIFGLLQLIWRIFTAFIWRLIRLPRNLLGLVFFVIGSIIRLPALVVKMVRAIGQGFWFLMTDRRYVGRFILLIFGSVLVVLISGRMASSIEGGLVEGLGLNRFFVGLIVLPIASGLVDIIAATGKAWEDDAQYSLAITAGSAVQVALFVAPVLVLLSQVFYGILPDINMIFGFFILAVFALIVYYYQVMTVDGETTWFEGAQLLAIFFGVASVVFLAGQHGGAGLTK